MGVTLSLVSCPGVTSAMSAIGGTNTTTTNIIPVKENGVHLVIERTARISQKLNDCWVRENSHYLLLFVVCVIDPFLVRTVTLTIFIVAVKTFHPFASPTENVPTALRLTRWRMLVNLELGLNSTNAVGANAPFVNNKCTSPPINVTSNAFQKRRMIPN